MNQDNKAKFEPNWLGPFVITTSYGSGAYQLAKPKGDPLHEYQQLSSQDVLCLAHEGYLIPKNWKKKF